LLPANQVSGTSFNGRSAGVEKALWVFALMSALNALTVKE
jgi:hypothetical protein